VPASVVAVAVVLTAKQPIQSHSAAQKLILDYLGDSTRHYLATWNQGQSARFEDTLSQTRFGGSRTV
jgi:hypothetical protein